MHSWCENTRWRLCKYKVFGTTKIYLNGKSKLWELCNYNTLIASGRIVRMVWMLVDTFQNILSVIVEEIT